MHEVFKFGKGIKTWTCGAKTRSGVPCQNAPMGNGRCRMHGGKSLSGIAHPNYKHGRYSKVWLAQLLGACFGETQGSDEAPNQAS